MLLAARPGPTYTSYESEDYAAQNADSEHIIVLLYKIESEVNCHVDIERGCAQRD